ncbi:MAG: HD domain-containing protein [bacterium]
MNEYDNVVKTKNNIRNNLEYIISLEKTEKKFFNLLEKHKNLDKEKIIKALDLAKKFHNGITRDEGTPYIVHTISVAIYAMEDGVDTDTVIVCLLHDILEDTDISEEEIRELF